MRVSHSHATFHTCPVELRAGVQGLSMKVMSARFEGSKLLLRGTLRSGLVGLALVAFGACSSKDEESGPPDPNAGNPVLGNGSGVAGGGSLSDGDEQNGFDGDDACVGQSAGAEATEAVLQLVVDTSGSMDQDAPGVRGSKWNATRSALLNAVAAMPASTSLGVVFYPDLPNDPDGECFDADADVGIARLEANGSAQRQRIQRAFQAQSPDGGTPTHDAYRFAVAALEQTDAPGSRFAVVITDGTPTYSLGCVGTGLVSDPVDPAPLVAEAAASSARGVRTFVIGSPGSEDARASLSRMAEAGGTARPGCSHQGPDYCHFDMTEQPNFAAALAEALGQIAGQALSCTYDIPTPPNGATLDPAKVNVRFQPSGADSELIPQSGDGRCSEGWQYSQDQQQIELCGSTCERVRGANGSLSLEFGCSTQIR
jgi:von Willebrand factor type A domain-containing protein